LGWAFFVTGRLTLFVNIWPVGVAASQIARMSGVSQSKSSQFERLNNGVNEVPRKAAQNAGKPGLLSRALIWLDN